MIRVQSPSQAADKYALLDLDKLRELTGNQFRDLDVQNAVNVLHRKGLLQLGATPPQVPQPAPDPAC